jgi:hypothetical protein
MTDKERDRKAQQDKQADELSTRLLQSIVIQATQMQPLVGGLIREEREILRSIDENLSELLDWIQGDAAATKE